MANCVTDDLARTLACRNGPAADHLKLISLLAIFFTSIFGIATPVLLGRFFKGKSTHDKAILLIKCFSAGVILSTALVHVLPDAYAALSDCHVASHHPWTKDFPFAGLVTLIGALLALLVDITATSHMEDSHRTASEYNAVGIREDVEGKKGVQLSKMEEEEELARLKQRLVSQVLEIGIIFHSVIIGVTMGMSQNACTIRPLVAALSFHQIFEGMGLGGCIAQAGFSTTTAGYMSLMFSATTPVGIMLGMIVYSLTGYDDNDPNALIAEGLLGSLSSGILIYMGLVDLIALDFFHNKLIKSVPTMKKVCFVAVLLGSTSMSLLAVWA